ncbi:hypothetical protein ACTRHB_002772 [Enterococcus faecium]
MENIISEVGVLGNVLKYIKRRSRMSDFFFFSASWYQLANLAGRPAFLKK